MSGESSEMFRKQRAGKRKCLLNSEALATPPED